jgi:2-Cys peroxiredoxin 5
MTSILAQAAHNVAASLLGNTHIQPGATIPAADVKEDSPDKATPLTLTGKNILVSSTSYLYRRYSAVRHRLGV